MFCRAFFKHMLKALDLFALPAQTPIFPNGSMSLQELVKRRIGHHTGKLRRGTFWHSFNPYYTGHFQA